MLNISTVAPWYNTAGGRSMRKKLLRAMIWSALRGGTAVACLRGGKPPRSRMWAARFLGSVSKALKVG
jgi:hypothetical protein